MSSSNLNEICLICREKNKLLISIQEILSGCGNLSVAEVLKSLNLFTFSDAINIRQFICTICAFQVKDFFELKSLCSRIKPDFKREFEENSNLVPGHWTGATKEIPNATCNERSTDTKPIIKAENKEENDKEKDCDEKNEEMESSEERIDSIDIDDGIFVKGVNWNCPSIIRKDDGNSEWNLKIRTLKQEEQNLSELCDNQDTQQSETTIEEKFKCSLCSKSFKHSNSLTYHMRQHTGEKPFTCHVCGLAFGMRRNLNVHMTQHTGNKLYSCNMCDKSFDWRQSLVQHQRIHSGEKPYNCNLCNKSFGWRQSFVQHQRIHSGEKPFRCKICSKSFRCHANLSVHELLHTGEKHNCDVCGKSFPLVKYLKNHKRLMHKNA